MIDEIKFKKIIISAREMTMAALERKKKKRCLIGTCFLYSDVEWLLIFVSEFYR